MYTSSSDAPTWSSSPSPVSGASVGADESMRGANPARSSRSATVQRDQSPVGAHAIRTAALEAAVTAGSFAGVRLAGSRSQATSNIATSARRAGELVRGAGEYLPEDRDRLLHLVHCPDRYARVSRERREW